MDISILGSNIRKLRDEKKLSAYKLAKLASVGAATISEIESGVRQSLNSSTIEKIALALEVKTDDLFAMENDTEYIVNDIDDTIEVIMASDELTLDDSPLTIVEKKQLKLLLKNAIEVIRLQRESLKTRDN